MKSFEHNEVSKNSASLKKDSCRQNDCIGAPARSCLAQSFKKGELVELSFKLPMPQSDLGITCLEQRQLSPAGKKINKVVY